MGGTFLTLLAVEVGETTVGLERPLVLLALPVLLAAIAYLVFRGRESGLAGDRTRIALLATRALVVTCLVVAAAGPYTVTATETPGDPRVRLLVDRSASMGVQPDVADVLEREIEAKGVDVSRSVVATGNRSRVGDAVVSNLRENGTILLVSDGRVTAGRGLSEAGLVANRLNATVNAVEISPNRTERFVRIGGPSTTSLEVQNRFLVAVDGVVPGSGGTDTTLVVSVDGEVIERANVTGEGTAVEVNHTFSQTGSHRITARIRGGDRFATNDVFRKTVQVVSKPKVLYVAREDYRLRDYLENLYNVTSATAVPSDLDPYAAVVLQDVPAGSVGNATALQRFVLNGNGLVVAGGDHAFEEGDYASSPLGAMVPVRPGQGDEKRRRIVLAVDVSGSTQGGLQVQKSLALDVLNQLGGQNSVGIVAFDDQAYRVADLGPLRTRRSGLKTKIRRLRPRGATSIASGLQGANQLLGDAPGTLILLSDGKVEGSRAIAAARRLRADDVEVVSVGVGDSTNPVVLRGIAQASDGIYLAADETSRLRIVYGGEGRQFRGGSLTVLERDHFITAGVEMTQRLPYSNEVSVKRGADYLVATGTGDPAVTAWRYGVGRVVAITAYGSRGGLDGMLSRPDSLVVSKSANWAIGDPRRKQSRVVRIPDTRVGAATPVVYRGEERPSSGNLSFTRGSAGTYEARIRPDRAGYPTTLGTEYAVNYRSEYAGFGRSPELTQLVESTGGKTYATDETEAIAKRVVQRARHVEKVREGWDWALLLAGLLVFTGEVCVRRLRHNRREEAIP